MIALAGAGGRYIIDPISSTRGGHITRIGNGEKNRQGKVRTGRLAHVAYFSETAFLDSAQYRAAV
jgi:hypothetical protein